MKFLLPFFFFLFSFVINSQEHTLSGVTENRAVEVIDAIEAAEREGAGLYFSVDLFDGLGVSLGHQFGLNYSLGLRFEAENRLQAATLLRPLESVRYGTFLDLMLGDSLNFVYLGSSFQHGHLSRPTLSSGLVWRIGENDGIMLGHEYSTLAEVFGERSGHTFRVGFVHFFKRR